MAGKEGKWGREGGWERGRERGREGGTTVEGGEKGGKEENGNCKTYMVQNNTENLVQSPSCPMW